LATHWRSTVTWIDDSGAKLSWRKIADCSEVPCHSSDICLGCFTFPKDSSGFREKGLPPSSFQTQRPHTRLEQRSATLTEVFMVDPLRLHGFAMPGIVRRASGGAGVPPGNAAKLQPVPARRGFYEHGQHQPAGHHRSGRLDRHTGIGRDRVAAVKNASRDTGKTTIGGIDSFDACRSAIEI
jgi:hypothetical protein